MDRAASPADRKRRKEATSRDGRHHRRQRKRSRIEARTGKELSSKKKNNKLKSRGKPAMAESSSQDLVSMPSLTQNAIESLAKGVPLLPAATIEANAKSTESVKPVADNNPSQKKDLILKLRMCLLEEKSNDGGTGRSGASEGGVLGGILGDGITSIKVLVMDSPARTLTKRVQEEKDDIDWIVAVRGYATTEPIWNVKFQLFPLVCLTSIVILSTCRRVPGGGDKCGSSVTSSLGVPFTYSHNSSTKAHAGTIGSFLKDRAPFLTTEELAGSHRVLDYCDDQPAKLTAICDAGTPAPSKAENSSSSSAQEQNVSSTSSLVTALFTSYSESSVTLATPVEENLRKVQDLLSRHSAMMTLQASSSASSSPSSRAIETFDAIASSPARRPAEHALELYNSTLREFTASQVDRQKASLGTNAGKESADRAVLVAERHNEALALAMKESGPLSTEMLCSWHKELLKDLHPDAGKIRTRTVRCGLTVFAPPARIQTELEMYCDGLQVLQKRLDLNKALDALLFAAVAMFGVVDIHPFLDGNGRLSRIVANYALRKLPFPINLFATPAQRAEYVLAMEKTRHCLSLTCAYGDVSHDDLVLILKSTGVFSSLVNLLLDRVGRAAMECNRVWEEKSGLAAEAAEARAARRARERASQGTCMICLEERPNIATLCCGKPTHLNCIAEWLSGQTTCPICRSEMPPISGRVIRAAGRLEESSSEEEEDEDQDETLDYAEDDHRAVARMARQHYNRMRETSTLLARVMEQMTTTNGFEDLGEGTSTTSDSDDEDFEDTTSTTTSNGEGEEQNQTSRQLRGRQRNYNEAHGNNEIVVQGNTTTSNAASHSGTSNNRQRLHVSLHDERDTTTTSTSSDHTNDSNDQERDPDGSNDDDETATADYDYLDAAEDTTYTIPAAAVQNPPRTYCVAVACRNRPAVDCTNSLCGRCCVFIGEFHCPRHNS